MRLWASMSGALHWGDRKTPRLWDWHGAIPRSVLVEKHDMEVKSSRLLLGAAVVALTAYAILSVQSERVPSPGQDNSGAIPVLGAEGSPTGLWSHGSAGRVRPSSRSGEPIAHTKGDSPTTADSPELTERQREWAASYKIPPSMINEWGMSLVVVPMFPQRVPCRSTRRQGRYFLYISTTEVSQLHVRRIATAGGRSLLEALSREWTALGIQNPEWPAVSLSFKSCEEICQLMSDSTSSRQHGLSYRLPTIDEWNAAAILGLKGERFLWGDRFEHAHKWANLSSDRVAWRRSTTILIPEILDPFLRWSPVGALRPSAGGLYDLIGNVKEYVYEPAEVAGPVMWNLATVGGSYVNTMGSEGLLVALPQRPFRLASSAERSVEGGFRIVCLRKQSDN